MSRLAPMFRRPGLMCRALTDGTCSVPVVLVLVLVGLLTAESLDVVSLMRWTGEWGHNGTYGLAAPIFGTAITGAYAVLATVTVGTPTAIYLGLYAPPWVSQMAWAALGILKSLPTVVLGVIGMKLVVPTIGASAAAASFVLLLVTLPTYITLVAKALNTVPTELRMTLRSLGIGEGWGTVRVMTHEVRTRILAAGAFATSRALGEAVAVSMVAGNVEGINLGLDPVLTLAGAIANKFNAAPSPEAQSALCAAGVVLAVIVGAFGLVAVWLESRSSGVKR